MPESGRIGYVVNAFPVVSETFLVNELRALEEEGIPLAIFTLSRRRDRVEHGTARRITAPVYRPPRPLPLGWLSILRAHLSRAWASPAEYRRLLGEDVLRPLLAAARRRRRKHWRRAWRSLRLFLLSPWLAERARHGGVVHLHAHYAKDPLEAAARARWLSGLPYSFAAHAKDLYTTPPERLARRLRKARFAVTCHGHGEATLRALAAPGDADKVMRVPHGVDRGLFSAGSYPREPALILAVGRLTPKKGFDTLVAACGWLWRRGRRLRCVIVGEGRLRGDLQGAIETEGLGGVVELHDFVSHEALAGWYRRATVLALPARVLEGGNRDGIPNVLVEAMACGTPVVATPVGGIPEIIRHGDNGVLVPPDDPEALAGALEGLLAAPRLRRRLGAAARATAGPDFRALAAPLAARFRSISRRGLQGVLRRVQAAGWAPGGLAERAALLLHRRPRFDERIETGIARSILSGLQANAWRPDLPRLIERRLWDEVVKARRAARLTRLLPAGAGSGAGRLRVLDLGCGRGGLSVAMQSQGLGVVAFDLRLRNCRVARLRGRRYDLEIAACTGRAEALPFGDTSFDLVCLLEILEHVGDPAALLAEARRVCRPEGACVVTVVNRWAHLDPHYRLWGINFLPRRLARAYISRRGRAKRSWGDHQTLDDMHYFTFTGFRRFARALGFEVHDPQVPARPLEAAVHRLGRKLSLGFNTATVLLLPR